MLNYFEHKGQIMSKGQKSLKFLLNNKTCFDFQIISSNVNLIESLDQGLKALCPTGKIKYSTAVKIIQG